MKLKAISRMGQNAKSEFRDECGQLLYYTSTTIENYASTTEIFDSNDSKVASLVYACERNTDAREFLLMMKNGQNFKFIFGPKISKKMLICKEHNLKIVRGAFDKSFKMYTDNKLVLTARTFTLFRDWLMATYKLEIFDESLKPFCFCVCVAMFAAISESAQTATNRHY